MLSCLLTLAWSHPDTPGAVLLDVGRTTVEVELRLPADMLRSGITGVAEPDMTTRPPGDERVASYVLQHLSLQAGGRDLELVIDDVVWVTVDGEAFARLDLSGRSDGPIGDLLLHDAVIIERYPPHVSYVTLRSDVADPEGQVRMVGRVTGGSVELPIPIAGTHEPMGVAMGALEDGVHHILAGADHLVFLLELLVVIPLVAGGGRWDAADEVPWRRLVGLLSMFTVAHSVTLLAATMGWVHVAARWVEVGVAATVVLAAAHLVRPLWPGREGWFVAFAGLIHGSAFAEYLLGSGLGGWQLLLPLAAFNLGIELAQLGVAVVMAPLWWWGRRWPWLRWGMAAVGGLAGGWWLVERL